MTTPLAGAQAAEQAVQNHSYTIGRITRHLFTGIDGESIDIGRVMWAVGVVAYIGMSIYQLVEHKTFDPMNWGSGFAIINGGSGVALKLKENTEPAATPPATTVDRG